MPHEIGDRIDSLSHSESLLICRYGAGCTHLLVDPTHGLRYYHPPTNRNISRLCFTCNECGMSFNNLSDLQLHLQKKTAWSNQSLIGSRVCCLINNKEWHEGYVTQYHNSGRHFVHFVSHGEGLWLNMIMMTFHIVEKRVHVQDADKETLEGVECKEQLDGNKNGLLSPDDYVYMEPLTLEFCFAQSMLSKIYGLIETGHKTKGHVCITENELNMTTTIKESFLYGELLPRGVNKALSPTRLYAASSSVLFDLGMGTGKIPIQAFLQFGNLDLVYGVELSLARYKVAEQAALDMVQILGANKFVVQCEPGRFIRIAEVGSSSGDKTSPVITPTGEYKGRRGRVLKLEYGNMFDVTNISSADIIMLETEIPVDLHPELCKLLRPMKPGARTLTYVDLRLMWTEGPCPFRRLDSNKYVSDRYSTSWSVQRGHHFFLWTKSNEVSSDYSLRSRKVEQRTPDIRNPFSCFFRDKSSGTDRQPSSSGSAHDIAADRNRFDDIREGNELSPQQLAMDNSSECSSSSSGCFPRLNIFNRKSKRSSLRLSPNLADGVVQPVASSSAVEGAATSGGKENVSIGRSRPPATNGDALEGNNSSSSPVLSTGSGESYKEQHLTTAAGSKGQYLAGNDVGVCLDGSSPASDKPHLQFDHDESMAANKASSRKHVASSAL